METKHSHRGCYLLEAVVECYHLFEVLLDLFVEQLVVAGLACELDCVPLLVLDLLDLGLNQCLLFVRLLIGVVLLFFVNKGLLSLEDKAPMGCLQLNISLAKLLQSASQLFE